ncbi:MAG: VWA domain-containing protein [Actinomycetota bacterium]|uniref:VWA domain-containing protein n=1 Tax=Mycobacterium lentiflavum TaxID=141349 RepID=A0ABY3UQS0_MYCLN|nr:VWA domain-containing protein [Mycobacterium lentiflavum]MEE3064004.1 VWA domain-containing protein [Actinomycetota bacterium]ULP40787.1 VWA domain-containing protein [Mycobacterium lentiflavum]
MTFQPVLPWPILAVVATALALARGVALWRVLVSAGLRRKSAVLRWGGVTLAVSLLILATTRPALARDESQRGTTPATGANLNFFLVVDRSADSDVDDYGTGEPRIAGMRDDIAALIKQYPAARYALIAFDSKASLDWPLSDDGWSLRPTVAALSANRKSVEVNAAAAANMLRYQLPQAAQQYPGSRNVLLYFGSRAPQGDFDISPPAAGAVLAYGRADAIDEPELREIARHLNMPYLHRDPGQPFRVELPDTGHGTDIEAERIQLYWLPALVAAGLLLAEIYLSVRDFRRGRIAGRDLAS